MKSRTRTSLATIAALALVLASVASATRPELRHARDAYADVFRETVDTSERLYKESNGIEAICYRAKRTQDDRAQAAIWRAVRLEAGQSHARWERWSDGLTQRLPNLADRVEAAKGGLKLESRIDLVEAHSRLDH